MKTTHHFFKVKVKPNIIGEKTYKNENITAKNY